MKFILELHAYAPELNKAHLMHKGERVKSYVVPGVKSIRVVRRMFAPLKYKGLFVTLSAKHEFNTSYDNKSTGYVLDIKSLKGALNGFRLRHNLADCKHSVKMRLIG